MAASSEMDLVLEALAARHADLAPVAEMLGRATADPLPALELVQAAGLLAGYHAHWRRQAWHAVRVGTALHRPIINPQSSHASRTFTYAGIASGIVADESGRYLLEHRTTGEDISLADAPFWNQLLLDGHAGRKLLALSEPDQPLQGILYDVVRRPEIRPRAIPHGAGKKPLAENLGTLREIDEGAYYGQALPEGYGADDDGRETWLLYFHRLAADVERRPAWYLQRRVMPRDDAALQRHATDLWQTAVEIRLAHRSGRHYRNSSACLGPRRPCEYLAICSGAETPSDAGWQRSADLHPELTLAGDAVPRNILTERRVQCFQLCRRQHYFRYELGLRPIEPPGGSQAWFSRLLRTGLAAWWRGRSSSADTTRLVNDSP
jgi:hypothetical protein